jgi:hypothetical protein
MPVRGSISRLDGHGVSQNRLVTSSVIAPGNSPAASQNESVAQPTSR